MHTKKQRKLQVEFASTDIREKSKHSSVNDTANKAKLPRLNMGGKAKVAY